MPRKRTTRLRPRKRGGESRYYGDFRDFAAVGGKIEALTPTGSKWATTDPDVAALLISQRLKQYEQAKRSLDVLSLRETGLTDFIAHHLDAKAQTGEVTKRWLEYVEIHLHAARDFWCPEINGSEPVDGDPPRVFRSLDSISVRDVQQYIAHFRKKKGKHGKPLAAGTIRAYLNSLSNLYRRAESEGCVPPGFNPVRSLIEKPRARRQEARWLEIHDAALYLEAARVYKPKRKRDVLPYAYPLIATFLLTGGREAEALGLEVEDISFDRKIVTFRPNDWRRLKTLTSLRTVPLWPQLEEILREYLYGGETPRVTGLLFPSRWKGEQKRIKDVRKMLDSVAEFAGWKPGDIRSKMFRHTYTAARLQTLDSGAPVSVYTVARELGHGGDSLVKRVYGHLGTVRHRSEVVEYVADQHREKLGDRLAGLRRPVTQGEKLGRHGRPSRLDGESNPPRSEAG